nr:ORF3 [Red fox Torque teno virus 2]
MQHLVTMGPFNVTQRDLNYLYEWTGGVMNTNISVALTYKSFWQWGGQTTHSGTDVVNPCSQGPQRLYIENPATIQQTAIHPWDLDTTGFITKDKMREILGGDEEADLGKNLEEEMDTDSIQPDLYEEEDSSSDWGSSEEEDEETPGERLKKTYKRLARERRRRKQLRLRLLKMLNE